MASQYGERWTRNVIHLHLRKIVDSIVSMANYKLSLLLASAYVAVGAGKCQALRPVINLSIPGGLKAR